MRRISSVVAIGILGALSAATAALATHTAQFAMSVDVRSAAKSVDEGQGGNCKWLVHSEVTIVNLSSTRTLRIVGADAFVDYTGPGGLNGHEPVAISSDGGMAGSVLAKSGQPGSQKTFVPVVTEFTIPCDADYAQIEFNIRGEFLNDDGTVAAHGQGAGDDPFMVNGTAVPVVALLGGAGLVGGVAAGFAFFQRKRRRSNAGRPLDERSHFVGAGDPR